MHVAAGRAPIPMVSICFVTLITFLHIHYNLFNPHATHQFINFLFSGHILSFHRLPGALLGTRDKKKMQNTSPWPRLCWGGEQVTKQLQYKYEKRWWRYELIPMEDYQGVGTLRGEEIMGVSFVWSLEKWVFRCSLCKQAMEKTPWWEEWHLQRHRGMEEWAYF